MSHDSELVLMSEARISRSLNRMAHEVMEQNTADVPIHLFGINERGCIVAQELKNILSKLPVNELHLHQLPLDEEGASEALSGISISSKHFPIIVDDVIFSGRTMFSAIEAVAAAVSPQELHTAALIDRGHRKFPIKAEFYGMELPTKLDEHVSVEVDQQKLQRVVLSKR